jgi:hypothetical protein
MRLLEDKKKKFGVPPSGGSFRIEIIPPEGGTPNTFSPNSVSYLSRKPFS